MIYKGKVAFNRGIGGDAFHMKLLLSKKISALPGQFINILVSKDYPPLLRRPFSVFDSGPKSVEIVYKVIGDATHILSAGKKGATLEFTGPLGNSYLDFLVPRTTTHVPRVFLIGGGTGAASIHYLAKELKKKKIKFTIIQGAGAKKQLIYRDKFRKMNCCFTTEDGSCGTKGLVTDVLGKKLEPGAIIFACGPKGMIKAIKKGAGRWEKGKGKSKGKKIKIFASFEEYMGCGIGACLSCVIPVKEKGKRLIYKRVCADGPVFNVKDVVL